MLANENLLDKPPKLVVFLVIDQGTPDLLNKYDKLYSGGLRFLVDMESTLPKPIMIIAIQVLVLDILF